VAGTSRRDEFPKREDSRFSHALSNKAVLTRELEDVASAHAEELAAVLPNLNAALAWPGVVS